MTIEDRALKGTEYTGLLWVGAYFAIAAALVGRSFHLWGALHAQPLGWKAPVDIGFELLVLPVPLLMSLAFRKMLRAELGKDLISMRTYRICDYWIAQLLLYAYFCLVIIQS